MIIIQGQYLTIPILSFISLLWESYVFTITYKYNKYISIIFKYNY